MKSNSLQQVITAAKQDVKKAKKHFPTMFPQYINMLHAKRNYEEAKKNYEEAKRIWRDL